MKKLSIIIPVYNEEATIEEVLRRVAAQEINGWEKEIIVVDDASSDNSKLKIQNAKRQLKIQNCILLEHTRNQGKGAAIRTAIQKITGDWCIIQDGDLEYDTAEYPRLITELEIGSAPIIYGSRELHPERRGYPHYVLGVRILSALVNILFGTRLTDVYTCYKLIPVPFLKSLTIESNGFELEAELTVKFLKRGYAIKEIPIDYHPRGFSEGKKIRPRDGIIGIWTIIKNRFTSQT